ncbi:hypothetical protein GCM10022199_23210 [Marihabitans asiaticum]|uniref:DNA-directed DNA polymerase n=1 Tax=Marihabitans asiaticum TaxID=415218 RepID=A0A560WA02_9MICO|nr:DNA polymerase [Marihabitans asiaticum]TWD14457.1 DNA polymerase-1 [Marihabitans asiaticum]
MTTSSAPRWRGLALLPDAGGVAVVETDGATSMATGRSEVEALITRLTPTTRWVTWSADELRPLILARLPLPRTWSVAEAHRLLHGGLRADPHRCWAAARGLDLGTLPSPPRTDLFALLDEGEDGGETEPSRTASPGGPVWPVRRDGYLRAEVDHSTLTTLEEAGAWAVAAVQVAHAQREALQQRGPRAIATCHSESAAAVLAVELERDGLPIDRPVLEELITRSAGARPITERDELARRADRDRSVLEAVPGIGRVDLRNPASVRQLLATAGVDVPSTRKWVLEQHADRHRVIPALLDWRRRERIATTYGWRWLDAHVGPDDRLRGAWSACDGAAGRMTAQAGLHSLPSELRPGVAAAPGHLIVRADLGQVEPRVLAAVSGDEAFAAATLAEDLYLPVAQRLGSDRSVAKVAVLAAMYGQRSGAAGEALRGLEREYPVAMRLLDHAQRRGEGGMPVWTVGGRLVRTNLPEQSERLGADQRQSLARARGRFARNAVIQGSAAELFKAWAVTVRESVRDLDAQVVLCLHDELLVHVRQEQAQRCADVVHEALAASSRRWVGHDRVRFVADVSVVRRWSEAKD